jgi:hypothetical protein
MGARIKLSDGWGVGAGRTREEASLSFMFGLDKHFSEYNYGKLGLIFLE